MNIAELLQQNPSPSDVALIDRSKEPVREVSVAEITHQVHVFAQALVDLGLPPGSRVGLLAGNLGEYYTVMFGAPAAGMVFVPLNTRLPESALLYIIQDADLKLLVTDDAHAALQSEVPKVVIGSTQWDQMMNGEPAEKAVDVLPNDVAIQIYTSGSTGKPKGVLLSHENVTFTVLEYGGALPGEVMLVSAPLYHKNASMASKLAFASGGRVVLLPQFAASEYLQAITEH